MYTYDNNIIGVTRFDLSCRPIPVGTLTLRILYIYCVCFHKRGCTWGCPEMYIVCWLLSLVLDGRGGGWLGGMVGRQAVG